MAEFRETYKLVKYINSGDYEKTFGGKAHRLDEAINNLIDQYYLKRRYFRVSKLKISQAIELALDKDKKYIRGMGDDNDGWFFDITPKGYHLIAKKFYFFRVGLWDESLKDYDKAQTVFVLIATSLLSALGGMIVGAIIKII